MDDPNDSIAMDAAFVAAVLKLAQDVASPGHAASLLATVIFNITRKSNISVAVISAIIEATFNALLQGRNVIVVDDPLGEGIQNPSEWN